MNLKEQLQKDFITKYKEKDIPSYMALRRINTEISNLEKSKAFIKAGKHIEDSQVIIVINGEVKKLKESISQLEDSKNNVETSRQDEINKTIESTQAEINALNIYLPQEMTQQEIQTIVDEVIQTNADSNMGLLMKEVMSRIKSNTQGKTANGKLVKEIVQASL